MEEPQPPRQARIDRSVPLVDPNRSNFGGASAGVGQETPSPETEDRDKAESLVPDPSPKIADGAPIREQPSVREITADDLASKWGITLPQDGSRVAEEGSQYVQAAEPEAVGVRTHDLIDKQNLPQRTRVIRGGLERTADATTRTDQGRISPIAPQERAGEVDGAADSTNYVEIADIVPGWRDISPNEAAQALAANAFFMEGENNDKKLAYAKEVISKAWQQIGDISDVEANGSGQTEEVVDRFGDSAAAFLQKLQENDPDQFNTAEGVEDYINNYLTDPPEGSDLAKAITALRSSGQQWAIKSPDEIAGILNIKNLKLPWSLRERFSNKAKQERIDELANLVVLQTLSNATQGEFIRNPNQYLNQNRDEGQPEDAVQVGQPTIESNAARVEGQAKSPDELRELILEYKSAEDRKTEIEKVIDGVLDDKPGSRWLTPAESTEVSEIEKRLESIGDIFEEQFGIGSVDRPGLYGRAFGDFNPTTDNEHHDGHFELLRLRDDIQDMAVAYYSGEDVTDEQIKDLLDKAAEIFSKYNEPPGRIKMTADEFLLAFKAGGVMADGRSQVSDQEPVRGAGRSQSHDAARVRQEAVQQVDVDTNKSRLSPEKKAWLKKASRKVGFTLAGVGVTALGGVAGYEFADNISNFNTNNARLVQTSLSAAASAVSMTMGLRGHRMDERQQRRLLTVQRGIHFAQMFVAGFAGGVAVEGALDVVSPTNFGADPEARDIGEFDAENYVKEVIDKLDPSTLLDQIPEAGDTVPSGPTIDTGDDHAPALPADGQDGGGVEPPAPTEPAEPAEPAPAAPEPQTPVEPAPVDVAAEPRPDGVDDRGWVWENGEIITGELENPTNYGDRLVLGDNGGQIGKLQAEIVNQWVEQHPEQDWTPDKVGREAFELWQKAEAGDITIDWSDPESIKSVVLEIEPLPSEHEYQQFAPIVAGGDEAQGVAPEPQSEIAVEAEKIEDLEPSNFDGWVRDGDGNIVGGVIDGAPEDRDNLVLSDTGENIPRLQKELAELHNTDGWSPGEVAEAAAKHYYDADNGAGVNWDNLQQEVAEIERPSQVGMQVEFPDENAVSGHQPQDLEARLEGMGPSDSPSREATENSDILDVKGYALDENRPDTVTYVRTGDFEATRTDYGALKDIWMVDANGDGHIDYALPGDAFAGQENSTGVAPIAYFGNGENAMIAYEDPSNNEWNVLVDGEYKQVDTFNSAYKGKGEWEVQGAVIDGKDHYYNPRQNSFVEAGGAPDAPAEATEGIGAIDNILSNVEGVTTFDQNSFQIAEGTNLSDVLVNLNKQSDLNFDSIIRQFHTANQRIADTSVAGYAEFAQLMESPNNLGVNTGLMVDGKSVQLVDVLDDIYAKRREFSLK